jgi:hypothetical protein
MVVDPNENNTSDQRHIEYFLWNRYSFEIFPTMISALISFILLANYKGLMSRWSEEAFTTLAKEVL